MVRGYNLKLVAICLMMLFIFQIAFPTVSFALTGGPSQPETTAFTPVGSSNLVDLATGNFSYSIPLMTVPGPNGGESLTLGYKAGATMEQEASWVGLGWDLNVGAINRNLRGLPDDFKGDDLIVKNFQKKRTIDKLKFNASQTFEIFGSILPSGNVNGNLYHIMDNYFNDYVGFGLGAGLSFGKDANSSVFGLNAGLDFSKDGLNIPVGLSIGNKLRLSMGLNFGGVQSLQSINFGLNYYIEQHNMDDPDGETVNLYGLSTGYSFAKSAPVGEIETVNKTVTSRIGASFDFGTNSTLAGLGLGGDLSKTTIEYNGATLKNGYGYIYSDFYDKENERSMYDVHKENNVPFEDASPNLAVPVFDHDLYSVTGNGVGGTFRAFRSDVGVLSPSKTIQTSKNGPISGAYQASVTPGMYYGIDLDYQTGNQSYSGPWIGNSNNMNDLDGKVNFRSKSTTTPLYSPFYFEFLGSQEKTNEAYLNAIDQEGTVNYGVYVDNNEEQASLTTESPSALNFNDFTVKVKSKFGKLANSSKNLINYSTNNKREVSGNHIGFKTRESLINENKTRKNIYSENVFPYTNSGQQIAYSSNGSGHHINEMSISSGGVNYVYGLPAYNKETKEYLYSAKPQNGNPHLIKTEEHKVPLNFTDPYLLVNKTNFQGYDNKTQEKIIPEYAYSYLLTEKYSDNYVDVLGDGPTNDDLGGWVKYNYTKVTDFNWRGPYGGSSYIKGSNSWDEDDKATFTEGRKDIHYLNSVETKTHLAVFEIGDRDDNVEASLNESIYSETGNNDGTGVKRSKYLKTIKLYSKKDENYGDISKMIPIKTVHFEYDYSLCQDVRNNSTVSADPKHIKGHQGGKLTLKKVYFTYQKNEKGSLTPYDFNYGDIADKNNNPDYVYMDKTDRWGNYHSTPMGFNSKEFPYVNQNDNTLDSKAGVWNLKSINLPSGGEIQVEYEADDYGYVQEEQAMQMFKIIGTGTSNSMAETTSNYNFHGAQRTVVTGELTHQDHNNSGLDHYIFFDRGSASTYAIDKYFENLSSPWLYFDVNVSLNKDYDNPKKFKPEKIKGYAEIVDNSWGINSNGIAYFKVKSAKYKCGNNSTDIGSVHPFRKAAIQHYHNRPDLKPKGPRIVEQVRTFMNGPIQNHLKKERASKIIFSAQFQNNNIHSFQNQNLIRLLNPNFKKKGGGHRVKTIRVNDMNGKIHGQKYNYSSYNESNEEISSGVADYEPIIGGEENSLRQPNNFSGILDYNTNTESNMYVQKPILEAFYPGAVVKYGKVTVENLTPSDLGRTSEIVENNGGITVTEHYTSKDFPIVEKNPNKSVSSHYKKRMVLPFVPRTTLEDNKIFSSGSVIILNDMSGKVKSVSTYDGATPTEDLTEGNAITKVTYNYHTDDKYPNRLNNKVTVLTSEDLSHEAIIGQKQDFYVYQQENLSLSKQNTGQVNILPGAFWPIWPSKTSTKSISQRRMISSIKVIRKTGVLKEVITKDDGRTTYASNLAFDANTGEAIVTKVKNDWDKPIYNFNYSGHWKYPILKGKYQNYRAKFKINGNSTTGFSIVGIKSLEENSIIQLGDILKRENGSNPELFYVTEVDYDNNLFKALKKDNSSGLQSNDILEVIESGYKNIQQNKVGNLVSLTNPLEFPRPSDYLQLFLERLENSLKNRSFIPEGHSICNTPVTFNFNNDSESNYADPLHIKWPSGINGGCVFNFFDRNGNFYDLSNFLNTANIDYSSLRKSSTGKRYLIDYSFLEVNSVAEVWTDCEIECDIEGILHASATEMSDDWEFNYIDAGNPEIDLTGTKLQNNTTYTLDPLVNLYAYKNKGTWLPHKSWVYQVNRKQTGTTGVNGVEINKDGEYDSFKLFRWDKNESENQDNKWEWTSKMTKYSPFGYDIENENRLEIPSSEIYGYGHSLVTAVGANANYQEIAYESFEESKGTNSSGVHQNYDMTGHFTGNVQSISTGHTGERAMYVPGLGYSLEQKNFKPKAGIKYFISVWVRTTGSYGGQQVIIKQNGSSLKTIGVPVFSSTKGHKNEIDGWTKIEGYFETPTTSNITLDFTPGASFTLFDDLRICPYEGAIQTYAYDPLSFNLIATLDNNNFATFYQRDSEGKVTVVKKETERGIVTVQSTQQNISKQ